MKYEEKALEGVMPALQFKVVDRLRACGDPEYVARLKEVSGDRSES